MCKIFILITLILHTMIKRLTFLWVISVLTITIILAVAARDVLQIVLKPISKK